MEVSGTVDIKAATEARIDSLGVDIIDSVDQFRGVAMELFADGVVNEGRLCALAVYKDNILI